MTSERTRNIFTREFILGYSSQFIFLFVFHILVPTLPIYLSRSGSSEVEIGVLIGVFFVSSLIFRPVVGRTLLRIPEKTFMLLGALLFVLTSLAYLWALPFWPFFIARFFQGIGLAFFHTATYTLIANISPKEHRAQSLSYFLLAANVSSAAPNMAGDYFLYAIAAVLLGMTMFDPGRPNVPGTLVAALILKVLGNGLVLMGAPYYVQDIVLRASEEPPEQRGIKKTYLAESEKTVSVSSQAQPAARPDSYFVAAATLKLHIIPLDISNVVKILKLNDKVAKISQSGSGWFKVRYLETGAEGWALARNLKDSPVTDTAHIVTKKKKPQKKPPPPNQQVQDPFASETLEPEGM